MSYRKLGLDNENATYPFVDLWSTDNTMQDVHGLCGKLCQMMTFAESMLTGPRFEVATDTA